MLLLTPGIDVEKCGCVWGFKQSFSPAPVQTLASHIAFHSSIPQLNSSPGHPLISTVNNLATLLNLSQCWDCLEEKQQCTGYILLLTFPVTTKIRTKTTIDIEDIK